MSVAMMLPTASAFLIAYAEIGESRAARGEPVVSPAVPALGYLAVWAAVSVAAALLQALVTAAVSTVTLPPAAATILAGAALGAAGLYQFSPTKLACLTRFRDPAPLIEDRWSADTWSVFRLGLEEGGRCFRSCWALMAVMLAVGAMNLIWMALFSLLIAGEKLSGSARVAKAIGVGLLAAGTALSLGAVGPARLLAVLGI
jgi:predicted metal-binding membrane protein